MIGFILAGFLIGFGMSVLVFGIFAARSYDKGSIDGYEQGKRDGFRIAKGMID